MQETFVIDRQWLLDHAIKFARWQHPAAGCVASFAMPFTTCFLSLLFSILSGIFCLFLIFVTVTSLKMHSVVFVGIRAKLRAVLHQTQRWR